MSTETPECTCPEPMSFGHEPGCPTLTRLVVAPPECQCGNKGLGAHEPACPFGSVQANNEQWSRVADGAVKEWEEQIRSLERQKSELTARIAELEKTITVVEGEQEFARLAQAKHFEYHREVSRRSLAERDELKKQLAEARKDSSWQPIETAPKDGTVILACAHDWKRPTEMKWNNFTGLLTFMNGTHPMFTPPTHWIPLPSTPLPETEGQI